MSILLNKKAAFLKKIGKPEKLNLHYVLENLLRLPTTLKYSALLCF